MLGGAYFAKCNQENIIGNIRTSARNSWELLRITGVGICISRNFSRRKRLCGGYAFCTIWIYAYVRLVSHNDNRNYSASEKKGEFAILYITLVHGISRMSGRSICNTLILDE